MHHACSLRNAVPQLPAGLYGSINCVYGVPWYALAPIAITCTLCAFVLRTNLYICIYEVPRKAP